MKVKGVADFFSGWAERVAVCVLASVVLVGSVAARCKAF
jgi:hypothetical protein